MNNEDYSINTGICVFEMVYLNMLHAMGSYMGPTGRTHGKATVTLSRWYSSKIVDWQKLIDYLAL